MYSNHNSNIKSVSLTIKCVGKKIDGYNGEEKHTQISLYRIDSRNYKSTHNLLKIEIRRRRRI